MKKLHLALVAATALTLAQPAAAAVVTETFIGHITNGAGVDTGGLFGAAGANLTGLAFTAVYRINTTAANTTIDVSDPRFDTIYNNAPSDAVTSPVTATMTVNGVTLNLLNFPDAIDALAERVIYPPGGNFWDITGNVNAFTSSGGFNYSTEVQTFAQSFTNAFLTLDLTQPIDYTLQPGDEGFGTFAYFVDNASNNHRVLTQSNTLSVDRVVVAAEALTAPGGVPEPSSWALMITGFGLAGATLRRRRTALA